MALPFYIAYICSLKEWTTLPVNAFNITRTFFSLSLFLLSCVELLKAVSDNEHHKVPAVIFVASGVKAGTFLLSSVLTQVERRRGLVTSGVQFTFWLVLLLASIIPLYTKIELQEYDTDIFNFVVFILYFVLVFVQLMLLFIPEKTSRRGYYELGIPPSPETKASFPSRVTFSWMNSLLITGYRKTLEENDLFELHPRDKSKTIIPAFNRVWQKEVNRVNRINRRLETKQHSQRADMETSADKDERTPLLEGSSHSISFTDGSQKKPLKLKKPSLFRVLFKLYGWTLLLSHVWKIFYDLLQFVNPLLLNALIAYVQIHGSKFEWKGYVYAGGFFVVAFLQSCFYQYHFHISMTLGMRIRSAVISAVYKKALTISNEARKSSTVGEIVNLMSVDCLRLQDVTGYLYIVWSAPLQISIALYMLYEQLGSSVFAGLAVMLLLFPIIGFIANKQRKYQIQQMKLKDTRIKLINEVLNGIKVLKLYAWEVSFQKKISDIRNQELNYLKKIAYLGALTAFAWTTVPYLVTLATFATYILSSEDNHLDAAKAFVSVSLFNILRIPINALPMCIPLIIQGAVSLVRLGRFLGSDDLDLDSVERDSNMDAAITVENGTFTWDRSMPTPTLKQINLQIAEGQLIAVVGQVGSGKSSLLSAFLGEMTKLEGKVFLKKSVAYVPQEAWIQNATIKDNILFGSDCHLSKYEKVIDACALTPDLDILPARDLTEIGEKGINLSGGQKQRVSLARAVYSNADIYLLDDPLSAVDSHVGKHIFNELISEKGLLKNKTRVLVTHGIHWLPRTDLIIVLKDGQISEMGSYEQLLSHDGAFSSFLKMYLTEEVESEEDEDPEIQEIRSKILERITSDTSVTDDKTELELSGKYQSVTRKRKKVKDEKMKDEKKFAVKDKIIQDETSESGQVKLAVFLEYSKAVGGLATLCMFVLYAVYQGGTIGSSIWLSLWTDDALLANLSVVNTTDYQNTNDKYLGIYALIGLLQACLMFAYSMVFAVRLVCAARSIHAKILYSILRAPMCFFDTTPIGRIVNRFSRDVETVDNNLPRTLRMWIMCVFSVLSVIVVVSYSTPIFLVMLVPLGILYILIQRFYIPTSRQLKRIESVTRSPIYTHFSETISGAHSIRAYQASERFIAESSSRVDKNLSFYFAGLASNRWLGFYLAFLGNIIVLAAALFAVLTDDLPSGIVGLSISYALEITQTLNYAVRMTSDLETNIVSVERLKEYSETSPEAEWEIPHKSPPRDWPHVGAVTFYNYYTRYRPGLALVLKGVNCDIQGGQKIGIVGRTGAGKSSLSVALFRLVEGVGGHITIDERNIADMGLHDLRSRLTILPQEPVLFSGSLRVNLDPLGERGDDELWDALEHCHLKTFVSELPTQLDYECGEGGQNLSVGQRQLLCLGRSLLRKSRILVLDEATAAVDLETDSLIQETIRTEFKDCTILTIAHRLNTVMDYDRIMVLDQGVIREFDTPDNLMADKQSMFYMLAKDAGLV
ncbi:multidrug resistance-associated protein 1-like isoform X2 [Gigantopelta aegis]|uniref:multidrug resistance-associated protein 1-like isoform X2 n=1 Tax=Gigantopelta aegis TaxID=1735272 RepID=UPI001B8890DC|nr:multidrug resistance-associated protein 1-like isoform X2 [Gigantopelta aegis]